MMGKFDFLKLFVLAIIPVVMSFSFGATSFAVTAKPTILEFSQPMCSACKKLNSVLPSVESKYAGKVTVKKINTSAHNSQTQKMMSKYKVTSVPTLIFIDENGKIVRKTTGAMSKGQLDSYFNDLID